MQGIRVIDNVIEVELDVNTAAHAASDVVCQPTELEGITNPNGCAVVQSIVLTDYDDQGVALTAFFLRSPITVGDNNAAMNVSDEAVGEILGHVNIGAADYHDLPNNQVATVPNVGIELKPNPSTPGSVWLMLRNGSGTPTYAGGRMTVKVGVLRG